MTEKIATEKKRIGRPPNTGDKKTRTVQFRCQERIYRRLVEAAQSNNRTMSQEIAARLTESLIRPSVFTETALTLMTEAASKSDAPGREQLYADIEDMSRQFNLLTERLRHTLEQGVNRRDPPAISAAAVTPKGGRINDRPYPSTRRAQLGTQI